MNDLIERAKALQAQGKTHPEIAAELGKSKSMVALYLNPALMEKHKAASRAQSAKRYKETPRAEYLAARQASRAKHKDAYNARQRARYASNPAVKLWMNAYRAHRTKTDPQFVARNTYRLRFAHWLFMRNAMKHNEEMERIVGCTKAEMLAQLQHQLETTKWREEGMDNRWTIDHIQPLFTFDMLDPVQLAKAMHHTNVRPLHRSLNSGRERREKIFMDRARQGPAYCTNLEKMTSSTGNIGDMGA